MRNMRLSAAVIAAIAIFVAACSSTPAATTAPTATVSLQLQWVPQAQFAGYFAADKQGYYTAQGLKVNFAARRPGRRAADRRLRPERP